MPEPTDITNAQLAALIGRTQADLDLIKRIVIPLALRTASLAKQAKAAGVHPSTLWRRRKRLATEAALAGGLHKLPVKRRAA